ncbi:MAG TPA: hypothetical protein ENK48_01090 [Gammaproteobacteria bacterium]|nr:hypothetical protein [Gammaproteobacteria bacterium]
MTPCPEQWRHTGERLSQKIRAAFEKKPDSAGILQGVRRFRRGRPHARVVLFPSPKNGGHIIPCEGRLEAATALALELDPRVTAYRSQPFCLPGPKVRPIVPDFLVRMGRLDGVIDVKPHGRLRQPRVIERMRWIRTYLAERGIAHYLITERSLQAYQQIRERLRLGQTATIPGPIRVQLLAQIRDGPMTVAALRALAEAHGLAPHSVERLAIDGHVRFQIDKPWDETTLIGDIDHADTDTRTPAPGWGTVQALGLPL